MKSFLPLAPRLTDNERNVIQWAFNLTHSIVAGKYNMPKPMCYAMNKLQDVVHALAKERCVSVEDGCSKDFLGFNKGYWEGIKEQLKGNKS